MKAIFAMLGTAALLSAGAGAQSMMEHAAAAAGAVGGTAGGKALSNGLDKILGRAAEAASDASRGPDKKATSTPAGAAPAVSKPAPAVAAAASAPGPEGPSSGDAAARPAGQAPRTRRRVAAVSGLQAGEAHRDLSSAADSLPPPPKPEDFEKVTEGESRDEVLSALGVPSSHVTIPDEGHLIEIMSWSDGQRRVGVVRVDNGKVVSKSF